MMSSLGILSSARVWLVVPLLGERELSCPMPLIEVGQSKTAHSQRRMDLSVPGRNGDHLGA